MKIRKISLGIAAAAVVVMSGLAGVSEAGVNVNIGLFAPPPVYVAPAPPPMAVIPGTYVYAVRDPEVNILFFGGYWWRPVEGRWYRSTRYDGSWAYVRPERVPRAIISLPPDYHRRVPYGHRIEYADFSHNWKRWERDRYWDHHGDRDDRRDWHGDRGDHRDHWDDHGRH